MTDTNPVNSGSDQRQPARSVRRAAAIGIPAGVAAAALLLAAGGAGWAARDATADPYSPFVPSAAPGAGAKAVDLRWGGGVVARLPLCGTGVEPPAASTRLRLLGAAAGFVTHGAERCVALDRAAIDVVLRTAQLDPAGCLLGELSAGRDVVVTGAPPELCKGFLDSPTPPEPTPTNSGVRALELP